MKKKLNYTYLLIILLFPAACQKKITPVKISDLSNKSVEREFDRVKQPISEIRDTVHLKPDDELLIDTLAYPMRSWISDIDFRKPYFKNKVARKVADFYAKNGFKSKWLDKKGANTLYYALVEIINRAYEYGLDPRQYPLEGINRELRKVFADANTNTKEMAKLDVRITTVFFLYTTHLKEGRIQNPGNSEMIWQKSVSGEDDVALLLAVNKPKKLKKRLEALHPDTDAYQELKEAYVYYHVLANTPEASQLRQIHIGSPVRPGETDPVISLVRKRLSYTDYRGKTISETKNSHYDEELVSAVKWFQRRHGLPSDGIIGPETVTRLNISFEEKAEEIALNLERMRWLPEEYSKHHIIVNIPDFQLSVYKKRKMKMKMKVIVGKKENPTPVFGDTLEHIVFSPTWTVPYSIIDEEIIASLKKDSLYCADRNYVFYKNGQKIDPVEEDWNRKDSLNPYQYKVVQQPGPGNALGKVKFMMPNLLSIYLHDTPQKQLFSNPTRTFSHGCIRVEKPVELARYLLGNRRNWRYAKIIDAMNDGEPRKVLLKKTFGVQIAYHTAWVDENGLVNFREDVYNLDEQHRQSLR